MARTRRGCGVRLLVWWQFPRALGVEGSAGPGGRRASWEPQFFDQDSLRSAPTMPATNQWAVSTLIREVLADPDLAHDDVFRRLLQAGPRGPGRGSGPPP